MQKNPRLSLRRPWGIAAFSHPDYDRRLRHWTESADPQLSGDDCGARGLAAICMPAYRRWGVPPRPEDPARIRAMTATVEPAASDRDGRRRKKGIFAGRPSGMHIFPAAVATGRLLQHATKTRTFYRSTAKIAAFSAAAPGTAAESGVLQHGTNIAIAIRQEQDISGGQQ